MAVIPLMEHELVRKRPLITSQEFLHGVALGQILGPFAMNLSLFVGYSATVIASLTFGCLRL